jgi:signal transduction histidine kinase
MKDLSLHILDIVQNSISAGAENISIVLEEDTAANTYTIVVKDDGCGMSPEVVARVTDPYYTSRTTRKVGLGIPLLKQNAEQTGGSFHIESGKGGNGYLRHCIRRQRGDGLPDGRAGETRY